MASVGQRYGLAGPFRCVFIAVTVTIVGWYWLSRQAPFRSAAQRGGWRLAIAVLSSLGMLTFGIGIAANRGTGSLPPDAKAHLMYDTSASLNLRRWVGRHNLEALPTVTGKSVRLRDRLYRIGSAEAGNVWP